jgi:uncharacterized membrane protein
MINIWVFLLAIAGFVISWFIFHKKRKKEHLVCIVGKRCETVLYSKYNKMFGFPNENLGMLYYFLLAVSVIIFLLGIESFGFISITVTLLSFAVLAFLFSLYLTYIQFFVLKATCDYCLSSALVNLLILIVELL